MQLDRRILLLLLATCACRALGLTPVRVTFLTDCQKYSDWQSLGMIFSFKMSGQPGKVTRVMCCSEADRAKYDKTLLNFSETHVAPDMTIHPRLHDNYAAYNKPEAVIDYLDHVTPEEEYVLVLDSDMILRRPFLVEDFHPKRGMAVGASYTYMIGVANELATRHIPEVAPRNDTLAGPYGRRADQVGGFFFLHRDDLKRMSHDWLRYTEDVRFDDQAYRLSGDVYAIHPGDKPWISEMYGYAFGAAKADVWHRWDTVSMIYPQYVPRSMPRVMHYGLHFSVTTAAGKEWGFDKHYHYNFNVSQCPPWDLSGDQPTAGVFEWPPRVSELTSPAENNIEAFLNYYMDLLSIETVGTVNAAVCEYHLDHCPPSQQLITVCSEAFDRYHEVTAATRQVERRLACMDLSKDADCSSWKQSGGCEQNAEYMVENCRKTCGACVPTHASTIQPPKASPGEAVLARMAQELKQGGGERDAGTGAGTGDVAASIVQHPKASVQGAHADHTSHGVGSSPRPMKKLHDAPPPSADAGTPMLSARALVLRCYRLTLSATEVKKCVAMARAGQQYDSGSTGSNTAQDAQARRLDKAALPTLAVAASTLKQHPKVGGLVGFVSRLSVGQVLLVALLVGALLVVPSRMLRLRWKRLRSGLRSE